MTELIVTRGLPACGKTTWAREWVAKDPEHRARVNRDDLRQQMFGRPAPLPYALEEMVTKAETAMADALLRRGVSVVIDAMNLKRKYVQRWWDLASRHHAVFGEKHFVVPVEECIRRDALRSRSVGEDVIVELAKRFHKVELFTPTREELNFRIYEPDINLPEAWIVDLDGTLARMNGRSPYDWHRVFEDEPVASVVELVRDLSKQRCIVIMSGREDVCRRDTEQWLTEHGIPYVELHMRSAGDKRADDLVKSEMFFDEVAPRWNVLGAIDDRNRVVAMWRRIGLMCAQVAEGDF